MSTLFVVGLGVWLTALALKSELPKQASVLSWIQVAGGVAIIVSPWISIGPA